MFRYLSRRLFETTTAAVSVLLLITSCGDQPDGDGSGGGAGIAGPGGGGAAGGMTAGGAAGGSMAGGAAGGTAGGSTAGGSGGGNGGGSAGGTAGGDAGGAAGGSAGGTAGGSAGGTAGGSAGGAAGGSAGGTAGGAGVDAGTPFSWRDAGVLNAAGAIGTAPRLAIDSSTGEVHLAWLEDSGNGLTAVLTGWAAGTPPTTAFSTPTVLGTVTSGNSDALALAAGFGTTVAVFRASTGSAALVSRRLVGGVLLSAEPAVAVASGTFVARFALSVDPGSGDAVLAWVESAFTANGLTSALKARRMVGGVWQAVETPASLTNNPTIPRLRVAAGGGRFAIAWLEDTTNSATTAATRYEAGAWSGRVVLTSAALGLPAERAVELAHTGTSFLVAYAVSNGAVSDITARVSSPAGWGNPSLVAADADFGVLQVAGDGVGNSFIAYRPTLADSPAIARFVSGAWSSLAGPALGQGTLADVVLTASTGGVLLAVSTRESSGSGGSAPTTVRASFLSGGALGSWSRIFELPVGQFARPRETGCAVAASGRAACVWSFGDGSLANDVWHALYR